MSARKLADLIVCTYCGADAGWPCLTSSYARATYPHTARTGPIYEAWRDGFREGQRDILDALDSAEEGSSAAVRYIERHRAQVGGGDRG